jgi:hypothetical protein
VVIVAPMAGDGVVIVAPMAASSKTAMVSSMACCGYWVIDDEVNEVDEDGADNEGNSGHFAGPLVTGMEKSK